MYWVRRGSSVFESEARLSIIGGNLKSKDNANIRRNIHVIYVSGPMSLQYDSFAGILLVPPRIRLWSVEEFRCVCMPQVACGVWF